MDRILDAHVTHPGYLGPHHPRIPHPIPGVWTSGRAHVAGQRPLGPPPSAASQWAAAISLQAGNTQGKIFIDSLFGYLLLVVYSLFSNWYGIFLLYICRIKLFKNKHGGVYFEAERRFYYNTIYFNIIKFKLNC